MKICRSIPVLALFAPAAALAGASFEIKSGDRVLFMGDTLMEREGSAAALEAIMTQKFAGVNFTARNLSFSADLPTGVSRASFDPASAGMERIKAQLDLVKPTVAVLGYGMAASLEELTYRAGDPNLNADPTRYGSVFSAAKFKADLGALMDAITAAGGGAPVRFVLLAPLRHEDVRATRPDLPDPAAHNQLLAEYTRVIRELAGERGARFVDQGAVAQQDAKAPLTLNGIHPSAGGMKKWAESVASELGWSGKPASSALQKALQRKNELFFHRWRPANHTYIFGFRKREQGRNAVEMEQFDALLEKADAAIASLKAGNPAPEEAVLPADAPAPKALEKPDFQLENGLEISLWAENPLLSKPVEMNWDAKGRLWVASTPIYPQIQPGAYSTDKVFILEDSTHSGRADKTTLFADDLLIPTGVEPVLEAGSGRNAAYVGASTELLLLRDSDGDGKADTREVILSGFGTEDTHHTVHSLRWGVDGRLYMSQSIYIHTHTETPWGVVRLNSGGVLAYDPRTEKVEVFAKGLVNNWGHQMDAAGQSFLTDGAGGNGVSWAFPGATFAPFEGAKGTMPSVSAGGYPKFCSLELIRSPYFPEAWQGNAITNDFRAHRIVRFSFNDLSRAEPPKSAYATTDQPDVVRTPDQSFRPIDVKLGPDGALYVADWTNPVINHGEVDFRDPRRDKVSGRIWRITHKDGKPVKWEALWDKETPQLLNGLLSKNMWEQQQSRLVLAGRLRSAQKGLEEWKSQKGTAEAELAAAFVRAAAFGPEGALKGLVVKDAATAAWEARWRGAAGAGAENLERLAALAKDASPRVRVEAMRALSRIPSAAAAEAVAVAAENQPAGDPQYAFAARLSMREVGGLWLKELEEGRWDWKGREDRLLKRLMTLEVPEAQRALSGVMKDLTLPADGSGPWTELVAYAGGKAEAAKVWALVQQPSQKAEVVHRGLEALLSAANRGMRPDGDLGGLGGFVGNANASVAASAMRLAGLWRVEALAPQLGAAAAGSNAALRNAAAEGLRSMGGDAALKEVRALLAPERPAEMRHLALGILAKVRPGDAVSEAQKMLGVVQAPGEALPVWRALTGVDPGLAQKVATEMKGKLSAASKEAALQAARELGRRGSGIEEALKNKEARPEANNSPQYWAKLVQERGNAAKGELIYHSARMICVQCHQIGGAGGKMGPDMSTIGASAPLDYVIESVLLPAAKVKEGYHGVSYTLNDGGSLTGVPFEENASVIRIRVPGGLEMEVPKAKIKSSEIIGSLMPAGLVEGLSEEEKINLFAFLGSVGRPGAYDASSGSVARVWRISVNAADAKAGVGLNAAPAVYSLTDGRLLPEHWALALAAAGSAQEVFATAKFQLGAAGKVDLKTVGTTQMWVDGKPVQAGVQALEAGEHILTVVVKTGNLPPVLQATATNARFVTP